MRSLDEAEWTALELFRFMGGCDKASYSQSNGSPLEVRLLEDSKVSPFPMGPGSDGPMGGMGGMEPHHMNGSLGSGDIDGLPKNSPNNISGISNPPGTPRDDVFSKHDDECVIPPPLL
eukprot:bmy_14863T0